MYVFFINCLMNIDIFFVIIVYFFYDVCYYFGCLVFCVLCVVFFFCFRGVVLLGLLDKFIFYFRV